jgi:hypothetical protein
MENETPMFGAATSFDEAGLPEPETAVADELAESEAMLTMKQAPDTVAFETVALWGQLPANFSNETPHNWSGMLSVNRGAIIVRRAIAFESETDHVLPRTDPQVVAFSSATAPHHDGLRLTILDPTPGAAEPQVLTYTTEGGVVFMTTLKELVAGPQGAQVDDANNRFVALALAHPVDACQFGLLGGRWHHVAKGRGRFLGIVADASGDPIGHVKGIYGVRESGEQVFFGKYINSAGEFRGILAGHYDNGHYAGKWLHTSGEVGALGGIYHESIPGPETGGHFIGRWAETSCNLEVGPGAPVP